jgi:hypothetical protein
VVVERLVRHRKKFAQKEEISVVPYFAGTQKIDKHP